MIQNKLWTIATVILTSMALLAWPFLGIYQQNDPNYSPTEEAIVRKLHREKDFQLVDPEQSPGPIHDLVKLGYNIMLHTKEYAPQYAGSRLSCTNCHFAGGNSTGGKNAGLSLVGVAAIYPQYNVRSQRVIDLPTRINTCFEHSLNGKPLPLDSQEMLALVTYLQWISSNVRIYQNVPWLGLKRITSTHVPDIQAGKHTYELHCALCHGKEGQGEIHALIPPLWGPDSFNRQAGMSQLWKLSSFIYYNMPHNDAALSQEEALNVASFILEQPRP